MTHLGPRILQDDFAPGITVKLQQKDLKLVLEAANDANLALHGTSTAHQLFNVIEGAGCGEEGIQSLIKAYEAQVRQAGPSRVALPATAASRRAPR